MDSIDGARDFSSICVLLLRLRCLLAQKGCENVVQCAHIASETKPGSCTFGIWLGIKHIVVIIHCVHHTQSASHDEPEA